MKLDDIRSPGLVPNSHRLRCEVVRAVAFAEVLSDSEKATELVLFFREAIDYLSKHVGAEEAPEGEKTVVDPEAASPFDDDELPKEPEPKPEPKTAPKTTTKKGK